MGYKLVFTPNIGHLGMYRTSGHYPYYEDAQYPAMFETERGKAIQSTLQLAQRILGGRKGVNKQIFMITDGKPSAIREHGRLYKNPFGLDPKIVNKTLEEAAHLRRKGITITTFMLAADPALLDFVRRLTELNHGRIYETDPNNLGAYVFRDFVRNRRKRLH